MNYNSNWQQKQLSDLFNKHIHVMQVRLNERHRNKKEADN